MKVKNGKTQEVGRRFDACSSEDKSKGLGGIRGSSEIDGTESVRTDKADSPREDFLRQVQKQREGAIGKIMERLNLIEDAFLSYVRGDQELLQARLDESKKNVENFLDIISHLKQEVYDSVSSDNKDEISE